LSDAQSILLEIRSRHGFLSPGLVVDEARPEDHPLHGRFEWDDALAAEAHRRDQARELIRSQRVAYREATPEERDRTVRAWVSVQSEDHGFVYEPTEEVVQSPFLAELTFRTMERRWKELQREYGHLREFWELVNGEQAA
jgi:hypothetical protein